MIVLKFGGTSVADVDRVREAIRITEAQPGKKAVVVSAAAGVTNMLLEAAKKASEGDDAAVDQIIDAIAERHLAIANGIRDAQEQAIAAVDLGEIHHDLKVRLSRVCHKSQLTSRESDAIVTSGERAMSVLMAAHLRSEGHRARHVFSNTIIATDAKYGRAKPDRALTRERAESIIRPLLDDDAIVVMTGFMGSAPDGSITTLGRSGSDYSATLLGAALDADEVQIWTDVPGVLSADPRLVDDARVVPQISFDEAQELAHFGAKVLHPRTIRPAVALDIPVRILSTFAVKEHGTRVTKHATGNHLKAVTSMTGLLLITIDVPELEDLSGAASAVFGALHEDRVDVILASQASSRRRMTYLIDCGASGGCASIRSRLEEALHEFEAEVGCIENVAIVAGVGQGAAEQPRALSQMLAELGKQGIPVLAASQQMSNAALVAAVPGESASRAVLAIHRKFLGSPARRRRNRRKRRSAMISEAMQVG